LTSLVSPVVADALPHVGLAHSLHATAGDYFKDEALRLAFSFQSAYLGMSPWECPGGFSMVPYVEHAWGIRHVRGGVHQLCLALARVAQSLGARVRTRAEVTRLVTLGDRCVAVELASGEKLAADEVIVNADAALALGRLLEHGPSLRWNRRHLEHLDESCSTFMLYLGLDRQLPLRHHTFFFAEDYRAEMERLFHAGVLGHDLSLYVCNPSVSDPTLAPEGHSALYVLALVPNTRSRVDWAEEGRWLYRTVLHALEQRSGLSIAPHVRAESSISPTQWERDYAVSHGAVFGPAHHIGQLLALRLPNQLPWPSNVLLAGGATSPGSGLPTILESARIATRLICERHGVAFPPSRALPPTG
jgi:phytoene desaturase